MEKKEDLLGIYQSMIQQVKDPLNKVFLLQQEEPQKQIRQNLEIQMSEISYSHISTQKKKDQEESQPNQIEEADQTPKFFIPRQFFAQFETLYKKNQDLFDTTDFKMFNASKFKVAKSFFSTSYEQINRQLAIKEGILFTLIYLSDLSGEHFRIKSVNPICELLNQKDDNRLICLEFACSDALNPRKFKCYILEKPEDFLSRLKEEIKEQSMLPKF